MTGYRGHWMRLPGRKNAHYFYDDQHVLCIGTWRPTITAPEGLLLATPKDVHCNRCQHAYNEAITHRAGDAESGRAWVCMCLNCRKVRGDL